MTATTDKPRRQTATERLNETLAEIRTQGHLDNWNALARELRAPTIVAAALITGRPELLRASLASVPENERDLYEVIAVLIETNAALRRHAEQLSIVVRNWGQAFKHLHSLGNRIEQFAMFETIGGPEDDDDDN